MPMVKEVIRNKAERQRLNAHVCTACEKFYEVFGALAFDIVLTSTDHAQGSTGRDVHIESRGRVWRWPFLAPLLLCARASERCLSHAGGQIGLKEMQRCLQECGRHRVSHEAPPGTPHSYWNMDFSSG